MLLDINNPVPQWWKNGKYNHKDTEGTKEEI